MPPAGRRSASASPKALPAPDSDSQAPAPAQRRSTSATRRATEKLRAARIAAGLEDDDAADGARASQRDWDAAIATYAGDVAAGRGRRIAFDANDDVRGTAAASGRSSAEESQDAAEVVWDRARRRAAGVAAAAAVKRHRSASPASPAAAPAAQRPAAVQVFSIFDIPIVLDTATLTVAELRAELRVRGLATDGARAALVARLDGHLAASGAAPSSSSSSQSALPSSSHRRAAQRSRAPPPPPSKKSARRGAKGKASGEPVSDLLHGLL